MGHVLLIEFPFFFQFLLKFNPVNLDCVKGTDFFIIVEDPGLNFIQINCYLFCLILNTGKLFIEIFNRFLQGEKIVLDAFNSRIQVFFIQFSGLGSFGRRKRCV
jgi:hypothetical protein